MDLSPLAEPAPTEQYRDLIEAARGAAARAYAPYSHFRVGAAVLGGSGRVYTGCNVENSSYSVTLCAERNAVGTAVAAGETTLVAVAVASPGPDPDDLTPCGMCRQFLAEFGEGIVVVCRQGGAWRATELRRLLPGAFVLGAG
ncbi:MAG TPA: cytidine deaminase [Thermoleophilia bacterium]|nr:cytidine deaminase [Thermoleophilia bacterium]